MSGLRDVVIIGSRENDAVYYDVLKRLGEADAVG
jgi:hypothetical protein